MTQPLFLSVLPDDVLRCDIFTYCTIADLSSLDQAMTTHKHRSDFLTALRGHQHTSWTVVTSEEKDQWMTARGVLLQQLTVSYISSSGSLDLIVPHYPSVTHLKLSSFVHISREDVSVLVAHCQKLIYLKLPDCDLTNALVEQLIVNNPTLQDLNLSDCSSINDDMLGLLGRLSSSLVSLDVSYCTSITDAGLALFAAAEEQQKTNGGHVRDSIAEIIVPRPLRELTLAHCCSITDRGIAHLLPLCPALRQLDVGHCPQVTDDSVHQVTQQCGERLTHLLLTNCYELSESGLHAIATRCSALVHLDLFNCHEMVTDTSAAVLGAGCPLLETLDMYNCRQLSDQGLSVLAQNCPLLKHLSVSSCVLITDSALYHISNHCRQLHSLDLSYCNKITNRGIDALRRNCLLLKSINLFKCQNVRNLDLMALFSS
jgi:hypothetical protein